MGTESPDFRASLAVLQEVTSAKRLAQISKMAVTAPVFLTRALQGSRAGMGPELSSHPRPAAELSLHLSGVGVGETRPEAASQRGKQTPHGC